MQTATSPRTSYLPQGVFLAVLLVFLGATALHASGPFDGWVRFDPSQGHGYIEVPHHADLNNGRLTIEMWVRVHENNCRSSLIGKNFTESYWFGICDFLRSFSNGLGSDEDNPDLLPLGEWMHVAVTITAGTRTHYVNGVKTLVSNSMPSTPSADPLRIGSDVAWEFTPDVEIDEVRLWGVDRSQEEIREHMNFPRDEGPGLIAVWHLDGSAQDALGNHDGGVFGDPGVVNFEQGANCLASARILCLRDNRFSVLVEWGDFPADTGFGIVVPGVQSPDSGLFYFFGDDNWEMLIKIISGCAINDRYWVFYSATTNVQFEVTVSDTVGGETRTYSNPLGMTAATVTDIDAFATCP